MKKNKLSIPVNLIVIISLMIGCLVLMTASSLSPAETNEVPYPEGYRNWTHVKTGLNQKGNPPLARSGDFHHIYGNIKAIEGYKTGKFDDGSIIVFDVLEAISRDSVVSEGKRKVIDVMVRDAQKFKTTGGWGYEEFAGDSKTERNVRAHAVTMCYNCHAQQKVNDNVFSKLRN